MPGLLVGRDAERAELERALDDAIGGRGGLVLVAGEPGVGKTALSEAITASAEQQGVIVRWGRCPEAMGAPAFWPWRQVLGDPPDDDPEVDRFMVFEGRMAALRDLAAPAGLVVVLDDLHWADHGSLRLLEHVAPSLRDTRALVIATYRDVEVDRGSAFEDSLGTLARMGAVLPLRGLDERAVTALAQDVQGAPLAPDVAAALTAHTDGNPFFVGQVLRLLQSEGGGASAGSLGVPPGVREVVRRRVARLGDEAAEALAAAAVLGRTVDLTALRAVSEVDVDKAVDAALVAGLLEPDPSQRAAVRFTHALVREVLETDLGRAGAMRLHARVLAHLLESSADEPDMLAARAYHALAAADAVGADEAAGHALGAAQAALDAGGYEEAIRLAEQALALGPDRRRRYDLLFVLGHAQFGADQNLASDASLLEAATLAEGDNDALRMARALLAIGTGRLVTSQSDLEVRLERALEMVSETELALRADLLSRLADVSSRHRAVPLRLAREALELARRSGDPEAVITAGGRLLLIGCGQMPLAERRALADEISACSSPASGFDPRMNASVMEILVLLEEGRLDEAARLAAAVGRETARMALVLQFNEPVKALVHLLRGELEQAEVVIQWFLQETQRRRATRDELDPSNGARMLGLMRERDLIPLVAGVIADFRQRSMTLAGHATLDVIEAALAAHGDDRDAASGAFDVALAHDLEELSRDWGGNGMAFCCLLADGAFMIDHVEAAARLAPIVARVADRNVVHGMPPPASYGWGSYYVGVCQLVLGELDAADASLRDALERNTAMGARPFVARTLLARARLALARGDGNGALEHAREAKAIAVRAGLALLERQADEWLAALGSAGDADAHEGTTTFVFTDIVGSTASTAAAGDRAWRDALEAHTSTVRALTAQHGGRLVKSLGDGFMLTFSSARAGVDFAIALQRDAGNGALELRVGVHTGEAEVVDGDHLGHNVNLAARVSGAAGAGEILVSDVVRAVLAGARDISWGDGRPTTLKGLAGEHVLHPVHAVQP